MNDLPVDVARIESIMQQTVGEIKQAVASNMHAKGRVASGRTIKSITTEVTQTASDIRGVVYVPDYFKYIERGSEPGRRGTWFFSLIHEWAKDKHIISGYTPEERRISGAIAYNIIKQGTAAFRAGGQDVFTTEVDTIIDHFKDTLQTEFVDAAKRLI